MEIVSGFWFKHLFIINNNYIELKFNVYFMDYCSYIFTMMRCTPNLYTGE